MVLNNDFFLNLTHLSHKILSDGYRKNKTSSEYKAVGGSETSDGYSIIFKNSYSGRFYRVFLSKRDLSELLRKSVNAASHPEFFKRTPLPW